MEQLLKQLIAELHALRRDLAVYHALNHPTNHHYQLNLREGSYISDPHEINLLLEGRAISPDFPVQLNEFLNYRPQAEA